MKLARINSLLLVAIIGINLYIVAMPFVPALTYWAKSHYTDSRKQLQTSLNRQQPMTNNSQFVDATGDRLIIPSMLLDTQIFEGKYQSTLSKGLWRLPTSGNPSQGGNTVIIGHRFTYTNPEGVFYNLNLVKTGDEIGIIWSGKKYLYYVTDVEIVSPNDVAVQLQTTKPQLTLYTCTPLWWPKNRLVVIAKPEVNI